MHIINDYNAIDKANWREFVLNHPRGNIFQTPEMYNVYRSTTNYKPYVFIAIDENKEIIGLLLSVLIKEKKGLLGYLTARSIIFGSPLIHGNNEVAHRLISSYNNTIRGKAIYSQIRNFADTSGLKDIFYELGYDYEDHLNILLDLSKGYEDLWNNYSRSRKKGIKKALNSDFIFLASNDVSLLDDFYQLLELSYARIKLPFPSKNHFLMLCRHLKNEEYKFFMLNLNGEYVASMVALQFKNTLYGYYMGLTNDTEIMRLKPSDLFFHKVLEWCIDKRVKTFDWMGAGKPNEEYGVRDFKLQFGGELVNFGRFTKIHKPFLYRSGKFAIKLWQQKRK